VATRVARSPVCWKTSQVQNSRSQIRGAVLAGLVLGGHALGVRLEVTG
jgi:hypothetical protein